MPRTAILKGYRVRVMYMDLSIGTYTFEYGDEAAMAKFLAELPMDTVDAYSVAKEWSAPGETVSLKVKRD